MSAINLYSDNVAPVAEPVMRALVQANSGTAPGYGTDELSRRLQSRFSSLFDTDVAVFPVATGTAANALSLAELIPPYGAVYCTSVGHIHDSECAATEFFSGGAKVVPLPDTDARLQPETLAAAIAAAGVGRAHRVQPAAVSLTQATERGTVYPVSAVRALSELAHAHGLGVHMDGARFANAVAHLGVPPADITWRAGVDILSFGATKNGAMSAEAIIVFNPRLVEGLRYRCRRAGQVFSKMRYAAAQLEAMITDGLWLDLAGRANAMARRLADGLAMIAGVRLLHPVEINEVFAELSEGLLLTLQSRGYGIVDRGGRQVRFVTAFNTRPDDIDELLSVARQSV